CRRHPALSRRPRLPRRRSHPMRLRSARPLSFALALLLAGCASSGDVLMSEGHGAARSLMRAAGPSLNASTTMIAATLANIDDLNSSSSFGRIASQPIVPVFTARVDPAVYVQLRTNFNEYVIV